MRLKDIRLAAVCAAMLAVALPGAHAAPCMTVTVTGAQGGPQAYQGQAGPGTLVRYGDDANNCNAVRLQFDIGRSTILRLSQLGIQSAQVGAVFITHLHNDHSEGLAELLQHRWMIFPKSPKLDVVCSDDVQAPLGFTMSCKKFVAHIADNAIQSGEIAQRLAENKERDAAGPSAKANVVTFAARNEPQTVWTSGDVKVSAIRSTHIPGHASYRVDTPAGSVVIGGDAGNDKFAPPRDSSTSAQVELLAKGADVIVHSTIHPAMGPDRDSGMPPPIFFRQSNASDLGAMAQRAGTKHLVLTHLIPPPGAASQGVWKVPGGALSEADYRKAAADGGFKGQVLVAKDLLSLRLPAK
ncbi:MAG: MBL fold metallo-hydrolase [Alphaproteobacteria bacterium]|nr:MBL fold metallo-hydrolase [Alphaproteobacteria bacterium]